MKKLGITLAVVAFAAVAAQAQTASANVVGYVKQGNSAGLQIQGIQFTSSSDTTVQGLFGNTLPVDSKVYTYAAGTGPYDIATYQAGFFGLPDSWDKDITLALGTSFWVELPAGSASVTNIQSGEVSSDASIDISIVTGLQLLSNPYPVETTVQGSGFSATVGDKIYVYSNTGGYDIATYQEGFFGLPDSWDKDITIGVGLGFWYEAAGPQTWTIGSPL
jgi:hypothetical protein